MVELPHLSMLAAQDIIRAEIKARGGRYHLIPARFSRDHQLRLLADLRTSGQLLLCSTALQVACVGACVAMPLHV
jgi:hypothetical protein